MEITKDELVNAIKNAKKKNVGIFSEVTEVTEQELTQEKELLII